MTRRLLALALFAFSAFGLTPPPYQRVLVPLHVPAIDGANGSRWTTELWVVNASSEAAPVAAVPCIVASNLIHCEPVVTVPPNRTVAIPALGTADKPGVLLHIPTPSASQMSFTLTARDLSKQSESWGVEVPVVRMHDFFTGPIHLTAIPFTSEYRLTLRIYALLENRETVQYRVKLYGIGPTEDELLREETIALHRPPPPPPNRTGAEISQRTLTGIFALDAPRPSRVRISIEPVTDPLAFVEPIPYWAFATVTNNTTQQVTTVIPR